MDNVAQQLKDHEETDRSTFTSIHSALGGIAVDVASLKADSKWQTWMLKGIVGAVLAGFIAQLYQIVQ